MLEETSATSCLDCLTSACSQCDHAIFYFLVLVWTREGQNYNCEIDNDT